MMLNEEPKIERAVTKLLEMLDREVVTALLPTRASELDAPVVEEAEQYLARPKMGAVQEHTANARKQLENALRGWLKAVDMSCT